MNISEAEEIEMRVFGAPHAAVRLEAGQEHRRLDQQNVDQGNVNVNHNSDVLQ